MACNGGICWLIPFKDTHRTITMTDPDGDTNTSGNTDPDELARFARLSHDWWDPRGRLRTLHAINPVRLAFMEAAVDLQGRRILDIGCGGGLLCEAMAARGARVIGIDPGADSIQVARQHRDSLDIDYRVCTVEEFARDSQEPFDIITCMEALEHVPDPAALIDSAATLLAPAVPCSCPPSTATRSLISQPWWRRNTSCTCFPRGPMITPGSSVPRNSPAGCAPLAWTWSRYGACIISPW
jgi:2-polyprenyl-3-methyl-5-hydroxy-6-metoxy-1,4-benzoquinol methylase